MGEDRIKSAPSQLEGLRGDTMLEPGAVSALLRLKELGFGTGHRVEVNTEARPGFGASIGDHMRRAYGAA